MILDLPLAEIQKLYKRGTVTPKDVVEEAYTNIEAVNTKLNALLAVRDKREVLKQLEGVDPTLPLYGIPYTLKDTYVTTEMPTTAGSRILDNFVSPYDATVHRKLREAGAILIGKANLDAWGHGSSTENNDYGVGKNPWDVTRVVGGSSGGPAAAVATRMGAFAIGEDTGGSIRNPSAWNNVSGLKVTYGRVSRYGSIAYASSLDTVGPMAKSVADLALLLGLMAGADRYDATSSPEPVPDYSRLLGNQSKLKIGIIPELLGQGLDTEIKKTLDQARNVFTTLGHQIVELSLPLTKLALADYYIIAPAETSSNLARYDGVRYGRTRDLFTQETMRRVLVGTYILSSGYYDAYYRQALKVRTLLVEAFKTTFSHCDVLLLPVNPTMPPHLGELLSDPLANMMTDLYTTPISLVGSPALAIPAGFGQSGLPIGMQLVGPKWSESTLLALGNAYQQVTSWHKRSPSL